uniref:Metalloendopeptidase n=1 Tax=Crassostrea virginica TaxID=6565 RepID=A0A8B8ADG0_CRAVI|nr:MAM and LDL-receptor class A domain-containing protein 1-like [Crassostrea virginica]
MGFLGTLLWTSFVFNVLANAGPTITQDNRVIGKREARLMLNELRKRHEMHVMKRSTANKFEIENSKLDLNLIARVLKDLEEEEERDPEKINTTPKPAVDGDKLIQEALKGNVDPNSEIVDLIESMFVDEGFKHNQHPSGIGKIASRKGKVYGDEHDGHRLTKEQLDELNHVDEGKRNFRKSASLWNEKIIPYTIDSSLSSNQAYVDTINKAIKQFDDYTCLKWVPRGSAGATVSYGSYIEFFSGSGCWSYVGRVFDAKQQISLKAPGCVSVSTTIHEMAHAIGQMHEQSRSDRDNHVTMLWSNIQGGRSNNNMAKTDTHDYNPYDYESVLQYSLTSFSIDGGPAMEFKDRRLDFLADSATGLMFYDIQDITDAYDCTVPCKGPKGDQPLKQCQNGGFVLHTCNCHCPGGLTGTLCETVVTDPVCGPGILNLADGESRNITSPNFNNGGPYPTGKTCVWLIKVPTGKFVQMTINEMDLTTKNGACDHWLEIQYNLIGQTGPRRCGKLTSSEVYTTSRYGTSQMMLLKFDSAFGATASAGKGFSLTVSAIGLGCQATPCVHGTCSDSQNGGYTCSCELGFTGKNCEVYAKSGDISCGFEDDKCLLRNSPSNKYDWTRHTGSTPSSYTGPSSSKTGSVYLYAESSYPVTTGSKFHFETPYLEAGPRCLTFWYHMYGSSMGSLNVLRNDTQVWTRSGDQGNSWHRAEIDIGTVGANYRVTFEAVRGSNYTSDIAIDDVILTSLACGSSTDAPTTQAPTTKAPTTLAPTTKTPTTQALTTKAPTTQNPTTKTTTTQAPTTRAPTTTTSTAHPGTLPTAGPAILSCTFEPNTDCFLADVVGSDNFNWSIRKEETPSYDTGPDTAIEGSYYAYIEVSGGTLGDQAILESQPIQMHSGSVCLTFAYHMYGQDIGTLEVMYEKYSYFYMMGDQGKQWRREKITLTSTDYTMNHKIQFKATRGDGYRGDIAVDDIRVTDGQCLVSCSDQPCGQNAVCIPDPSDGYKCECPAGYSGVDCDTVIGQVNCTFEDGEVCFLQNSKMDDFDWTFNSGNTPSFDTGPSAASEGTKYVYIEASGKMSGDVASLRSSANFEAGNRCLVFDYHMYGDGMGTLRVLKESGDGTTTELFKRTGQQNSSPTGWKTTSIDVYHSTTDSIVFDGSGGSSYRGDIAIDNIRYIPGNCGCETKVCLNGGTCLKTENGGLCSCSAGYSGSRCETVEGTIATCTFDGDASSCFLKNINGDNMDWTFRSGSTPSYGTGPGKSPGGMYAYVEASGQQYGSKAMLSSEAASLATTGPACLSFFYNMYGTSMGTLNVWAGDRSQEKKVWTLSGNQGDAWTSAQVDVPTSDDLVIIFEGICGNGYKSDIVIDTVRLLDKPCTAPSA